MMPDYLMNGLLAIYDEHLHHGAAQITSGFEEDGAEDNEDNAIQIQGVGVETSFSAPGSPAGVPEGGTFQPPISGNRGTSTWGDLSQIFKIRLFENFATAEKDLLDKAKSHDYTCVYEIFGTCKPVWHIASILWVPSRASYR